MSLKAKGNFHQKTILRHNCSRILNYNNANSY